MIAYCVLLRLASRGAAQKAKLLQFFSGLGLAALLPGLVGLMP
jgi:hypothetical protein